MAVQTIKTLTLSLDDTQVECQLTRAALVDAPTTEELQTFCGTETSSIPNYNLEIAGFADWGSADSLCDLVHESYIAEPTADLDFVLTVGSKTRSGTCRATNDPVFGGDAGAALQTDTITLDVIGTPVDGTATP